jgi:DNA-directed RNA polymerase specialized sigma24 family protein
VSLPDALRDVLAQLPEPEQKMFALLVLHGVPLRDASRQGCGDFETLSSRITGAMKRIQAGLDQAGYTRDRLLGELRQR